SFVPQAVSLWPPESNVLTLAIIHSGERTQGNAARRISTCRSEKAARMKRTERTSSAQVLKKTQPEEFDLVILGGGTGSTIAAWTFAGEGKQVAVVERKYIGGSCPNIACLPSKNIIHSAKVASYFRRSEEFGIPSRDFA